MPDAAVHRPADVHVVMLVANDVANDTRVKKEALALAQAGLRVTVVGAASEGTPRRSRMGDVEIVRVPVDFAIRDAQLRARRAAAPSRLLDPATEAKVTSRIAARERRVSGRSALAVQRRRDDAVGSALFKAGVVERRLERLALKAARRAAWLQGGAARRWQRRSAARAVQAAGASGPVVSWREQHPQILDYEVAFGPVVDALAPDVLHAHDMHVVGIAAHARARAAQAGRDVPWVYDSHEYVPGLSQYGGRTAEVIAGWADLEDEFIRDAARVVTVSAPIAEALRERYGLPRRPTVVLNIPTVDPPGPEPVRTLREVCGVPEGVPLLSYSGGMTRARGVHTAIEAMVHLPQAHLGLVCVPHNDTWFVRELRQEAAEAGVADRVHFVNPVAPGQVVDFLRGVDVGLIPLLSYPSHEMALPNKLFEYLHAGVPVVSSELATLGPFLRETGTGLTFPAQDAAALAAAVSTLLEDRPRFVQAVRDPGLLRRYSWRSQADDLRALYADLLGIPLQGADEPVGGADGGGDDGGDDVGAVDEVVDLTEAELPDGPGGLR